MDTSDPAITFDEAGVSNHYHYYQQLAGHYVLEGDEAKAQLDEVVDQIKFHGRSRDYDCILGISGGVDSSYLALLCKELGLRPLLVHLDNGWNSELAVANIQTLVDKLGFDLYTHVVNWNEFKALQRAYFAAGVIDIEVLTDHGFMALLYKKAFRERIKYVLGGMNVVSEGILPRAWIADKADLENMNRTVRKNADTTLRQCSTFPTLHPISRNAMNRVMNFELVSPLNWVPFEYEEVKARITSELGWRDYGGKHYESVFTRFYQGYILPQRFGVDKRRAHFSSLICSGQMTRDEALQRLEVNEYREDLCQRDKIFVMKKLGFSEAGFDDYMQSPINDHAAYGSSQSLYERYPFLKVIRPVASWLFPPRKPLS